MKLLILGGTVFLGRHLVEAALEAGHEVTLFNRGRSDPDAFPETERLIGDRDGSLDGLRGRSWDAVVDTSGYVPRVVRQTAAMELGRYVFISTVSVYSDQKVPTWTEDSERWILGDPATEDVGAQYGGLKALCEDVLPAGSLVIRPGLIVGPHDPTERFTYWPLRVHRGGEVLAPPDRLAQFIDVRDLAGWTLRLIEEGAGGVFNAVNQGVGVSRLLHNADATWVSDEFLLEQGVAPYTELPLWIPGPYPRVDVSRGLAAGLSIRSPDETWCDTLEWALARLAPPVPQESGGRVRRPGGLAPERERSLLEAWHRAN